MEILTFYDHTDEHRLKHGFNAALSTLFCEPSKVRMMLLVVKLFNASDPERGRRSPLRFLMGFRARTAPGSLRHVAALLYNPITMSTPHHHDHGDHHNDHKLDHHREVHSSDEAGHRAHQHSHGGHSHAPASFGRAFAIGITLNLAFVLVEAFYGWQAGSLALLADAGHNLSDVGGLVLAWAAIAAGRLRPDDRHTYGWQRGSIMASFVNAVILLVAMGSLAWEAVHRLQAPSPIEGITVMVVAAIGVVINGITAALFMAGSKNDLNIRGAFLHMAADALVSVGVVIAGGLYLWRGWSWIDPVMSLIIAAVIVIGTWSLFRQSLHLMFDGVPDNIRLNEVRRRLQELPGVLLVHDLHVWAMATSENALTAHLVFNGNQEEREALLLSANEMLHHHFELRHVTLQLESEDFAKNCVPCVGKEK
ncbi:cation diffusion facilitator family transporter [soil metagenome]